MLVEVCGQEYEMVLQNRPMAQPQQSVIAMQRTCAVKELHRPLQLTILPEHCHVDARRRRRPELRRAGFVQGGEIEWHGTSAGAPDWSDASRLVAFR